MDAVPPWTTAFFADWMQPAGGPWEEALEAGAAGWQALLEACGQETLLTAGPWQSFWQFGKALSGYHEMQPELSVQEALDSLLDDLIRGIDLVLSGEAALEASLPPAPESMPAFGLWREWQKLGAALSGALQAERATGIRLRQRQWQALRRGAVRLRERLRDGEEAMGQITSLQGLYNLVIDQFEEAYQRELKTGLYAEAFGQHANAGLRLREVMAQLVAKTQRSLGVPTAADLEALAERLRVLETAAARAPDATVTTQATSGAVAAGSGGLRERASARAKPAPLPPAPAAKRAAKSAPKTAAKAPAKARRPAAPDFDIGGIASRRPKQH